MITLMYETGEVLELNIDTLVGANFEGKNLHRIVFDGKILHDCNFSNGLLRNAAFVGADLSRAKFRGAKLMNAYFMGAILKDCDLQSAVLVGADFTSADLTGANLSNTDARFCSFKRAVVKGAHVGVLDPKAVDWEDAIYDSETIWPVGFDPTAFGLVSA